MFTGGEDRNITAWDTKSGKVAYSIEDAHSARIKGISVISKGGDETFEDGPCIVASASSDGVIRVWDVRVANNINPTPLAEAKTKSRLTCLAGSSFRCMEIVLSVYIFRICFKVLFVILFSFIYKKREVTMHLNFLCSEDIPSHLCSALPVPILWLYVYV